MTSFMEFVENAGMEGGPLELLSEFQYLICASSDIRN